MNWFGIVILVFIGLNLWCHLGLYQMLHNAIKILLINSDDIRDIKKHLALSDVEHLTKQDIKNYKA